MLAAYGYGDASARRNVDGREPVMAVGLRAAGKGEEFVLNAFGDFAARAGTYLDTVDGTDGSDLDCRAAEKNFLGDVKHLARNDLLGDGDIQVPANG